KETKESKDGKETKETKEHKDGKETKEHKEEKDGKEGLNAVERLPVAPPEGQPPELWAMNDENADRNAGVDDAEPGRAFIRIDERPSVGDRILARDPQPPSFAP